MQRFSAWFLPPSSEPLITNGHCACRSLSGVSWPRRGEFLPTVSIDKAAFELWQILSQVHLRFRCTVSVVAGFLDVRMLLRQKAVAPISGASSRRLDGIKASPVPCNCLRA